MTARILGSVGACAAVILGPHSSARADACLPDSSFRNVEIAGDVVRLCAGDDAARVCGQIDLASGAWSAAPVTGDRPLALSEIRPTSVHACAHDGGPCVDVAPAGLPAAQFTGAAASADGAYVAAWRAMSAVTVYEVATGAALATIPSWVTSMSDGKAGAQIQDVQILGDTVEVMVSESPVSDSARLFALHGGKPRGHVGAAHTEVDEVTPVALGGDRYAFATFQTGALIIENVKTGRVERTIKLSPKPLEPTLAMRLAADGKRVILVPAGGALPILVVDPKAGTIAKRVPLPICKAP